MKLIANETIFYRSPDPAGLYCYTPWIDHGFNGRLVASFDIAGKSLCNEAGPKSKHGDYGANQLRIYVSDDNGFTWRETGRLPMLHARVFTAGNAMYALGHGGDLLIARSDDNGETWGEAVCLDNSPFWHQSAGSYERLNGKIYITLEMTPRTDIFAGGGGDPILMCAKETDDLTKRENWTFSNRLRYAETASRYPVPGNGKFTNWLESSVVLQRNPDSIFSGELLIYLRVQHPEFPDTAILLRGREHADGSLTVETISDQLFYIPFPGGFMKFHILWDEPSKRYWLIASRSRVTTFMKAETTPRDILWFNERRKLELFYSENGFDWCSAGVVAYGETELESRHYASIVITGDDMLVLSRSGDKEAVNTHDTDMITLHRIKNFRDLA